MPSWPALVRHFSPSADPGLHDPLGVRMSPLLMVTLDKARGSLGASFVVTSGWRDPDRNADVGGASDSTHLTGDAVDGYFDGYFDGISLLVAFAHVMRYDAFNGIGLYPHTTPPTLHVDVRRRHDGLKTVWIRDPQGRYLYAPTTAFNAALQELARA